jgi:hypothetical protein
VAYLLSAGAPGLVHPAAIAVPHEGGHTQAGKL